MSLHTALHWYSLGVTPLPVVANTKRVAIPWKTYQITQPTKREVIHWFCKPQQNIALVCGPASNGLVVLDFDHGMDTYRQWQITHPELANTYAVRTHKGAHAYLFCSGELPQRVFMAGDIEVRGWLCTMTAPSVHPTGTVYMALNENPVLRIDNLAQALGGSATPTARGVEEEETAIDADPVTTFLPTPRGFGRRKPSLASDSDNPITCIKQQLPLLQLVSRHTDPISSSNDGRWYIMNCPFHADSNPSFWVDSVNQVCGCHQPECKAQQPNQRSMDIISFYARMHKMSNKRAICALACELGI